MKRHKQRARVLKYGVRQYIYDVDIGSIMKKEKERKRNEKKMKRDEAKPPTQIIVHNIQIGQIIQQPSEK